MKFSLESLFETVSSKHLFVLGSLSGKNKAVTSFSMVLKPFVFRHWGFKKKLCIFYVKYSLYCKGKPSLLRLFFFLF